MDLRHLRYFVRTIESSSISRAAQSLNIAQPSLSQCIRELEADLGVVLLHRLPNGIRPTEIGTMVADRARAILRLTDTLQSEARSAGTVAVGDVLVGLPTTMALHLTVPLVQAVRRDFPHIRLRVSEGMSGHIQEWVLSGRLDIAVLYTSDPVDGLEIEAIADEDLCLISRSDPAVPATDIPFARLRDYPVVLPGPDHGLRRSIERIRIAAAHALNVAVEVDSLPHMKRLAMDDGLHTILPAAACRDEILAGKLVARRIHSPPLIRTVVLATSINRPLSLAGQYIRDIVRAMVAGAVRPEG